MGKVVRYVPNSVNKFLISNIHTIVKWNNKDLSSEIVKLDYESLVSVVDTVLRMSGLHEMDRNNYVDIPSSAFTGIVGSHDYRHYLNYLIENKIIASDNQYIVGEKSMGYKINYYHLDNIIGILITSRKLARKFFAGVNSNSNTRSLPISKKCKKNHTNYTIDLPNAMMFLHHNYINEIPDSKGIKMNKYSKIALEVKLLAIDDGQFWVKRSRTNGRITNNTSILNTDYRQFITGYHFNVDTKASQPSLFRFIVNFIDYCKGKQLNPTIEPMYKRFSVYGQRIFGKKEYENIINIFKTIKTDGDDINRWNDNCENSDIYLEFKRSISYNSDTELTRHEIKKIFFELMYSSVNGQKSEHYRLMIKEYPNIVRIFNKIKVILKGKKRHKLLPILMQAIESFIWVENILPELDKLNISYIFIHDSVLVSSADKDLTTSIIDSYYKKCGIKAQLDSDDLSKPNYKRKGKVNNPEQTLS